MTSLLVQTFIYLCAAVIMVPLAKRLGLGSVLGYLIAGVIIGPITGLVGQEASTIQHFAEFGVVMMLFLVGLELEPSALWKMRHRLLGLGGLQLLMTTVAILGIALLLGQSWTVALAIGLIFSLSSTAIVLQTFSEKGLIKTDGGKNAFSVLLFQDIAVIPIMALLPLLALPELQSAAASLVNTAVQSEDLSLVAGLPAWAAATVILVTIIGLMAGGHYLSRPLFHYVAKSNLPEVFTATALMLVIGIAALMNLVGLSPALGTFLAGVVLASSEFRHQLEADIEPFKGLLLGLFFITVGAGINFDILRENLVMIIALTLGLMVLKALVLMVLAFIFKIRGSDRWLFFLSLAQAGEFGLVLLSYAITQHILPENLAQALSIVVAISMFLTPVLFIIYDKAIMPRFKPTKVDREADAIHEKGKVIIVGIGRFGQVVNRLLIANNIPTIVLDHQITQIDRMRRMNVKSYYGDASRPELLHTAGIEDASLIVIAINHGTRSIEIVKHVKQNYPHVQVLARAYDRAHLYELKEAGADYVIGETYSSALNVAGEALRILGISPSKVEVLKKKFTCVEDKHFDKLFHSWRDEGESFVFDEHFLKLFMNIEEELIKTMQREYDENETETIGNILVDDEPKS